MDAAYLHLLVNHFPIILSIMGVAAAIVALLVHRRAAWLYAAASLTIAGATAYPVMLTGHGAEDVMKHKWYVTKEAIENHEEAADIATWVLIATGVLNAFAWWRIARAGRNEAGADVLPGKILQGLVLVTGLAGLGTVSYAALQGGKIVHGSAQLDAGPGASPTPGAPAVPAPAAPTPAAPAQPADSSASHHM